MDPVSKVVGEAALTALDAFLRFLIGRMLDRLADQARRRLWKPQ